MAIPKVIQGTSEQVTQAAAKTLDSWGLTNEVVGMSFDTTAANTGHLRGACVLLQQRLGKEFLWLACRHHILEVLCGDEFRKVFGPMSGPNIILFCRFREYWPKINQTAYKSCSGRRLDESLSALKHNSVAFHFDILTGKAERSVMYTGKDDLSDKTLDYFMGPASHFFFLHSSY